jgi:hypothetical protein
MNAVRAVYNFLVGDMVILVGIVITLIILTLMNTLPALAPIRGASGYLLIVAILIVLGLTLNRETRKR